MRAKKTFSSGLIYVICVGILLLTVSTCRNSGSESDVVKIEEISKLFADVPVHPGKSEIKSDKTMEGGKAAVIKTYKSDAPFEEIREYYVKRLSEKGWRLAAERELKDRGRIYGERIVEFQKGRFVLSVQYAAERRETLGWDYALRIAYPEDNRRKV
jgi:hypothetical protein